MFILTKNDEGKKFTLDKSKLVVTLVSAMDGHRGVVVNEYGQSMTVLAGRLDPIEGEDKKVSNVSTKTKKLEKRPVPAEKPDKDDPTALEILNIKLLVKSRDGMIEELELKDEKAKLWGIYMRQVCLFAHEHGKLPPFGELWKKK